MSKKKDYDKIHRNNLDVYARKVDAVYGCAIKEAVAISGSIGDFNSNNIFSFDDYPIASDRAKKLFQSFQSNLETVILNGIDHEWTLSNNKNNELARGVFGDKVGKLTPTQERKYFSNNNNALEAFKKRKNTGLGLSDRVWNYSNKFKTEIELGLDFGLRDGSSASRMSHDLKEYLKYPDKLFRRVRDEHGTLQLSKAAKAFNPGQGVYRSSAKNAQRLARTEINMAYRTADHERWQQFDFVVGIEVKRSNNLSCNCPLCDSLAGKYPKDFKFTGWHPQCRCHAIPILKTTNELQQETVQILQGKPTSPDSTNTITSVPNNFTEWIDKNKERFGANNTPYFIRDNFKDGKIVEGLSFTSGVNKRVVNTIIVPKPLSIQERADIRHKNRTEEQINDIQSRWDERKVAVNNNNTDKTSKLNEFIQHLEKSNIDYNEVKALPNQLNEVDIIARVGGGDLTNGSCSSLAFTYAGNKCGLDVLDFRDGASRQMFSSSGTIMNIAEKVGGVINKNVNDFVNAKTLLTNIKVGKEYYFTCGKHASIVRKTSTGYEYLELQSAINNGFKSLNNDVLKRRFGAKKSHTMYGAKYEVRECIIDIELLKNNTGFKKMLGYINTNESKQQKGQKGTMK